MPRLVVHAGTRATGWATIQRQLVSWREPLDRLGVRLHPSADPAAWLSDGYAVAEAPAPGAIVTAAISAVRDQAEILLVSSQQLEDSLRDPARLVNLVSFAEEVGMPLTVIVVVRDQLGYLNELYCERIGHLQMARDFPSYAADPSPRERFDYGTAFSPLLDAPEIDFVAVPYRELSPTAPAKGLLAACGLAPDALAELPEGPSDERLPGPVLVAANRLLFKRLWRLGLFTNLPRPRLSQSAQALVQHAEDHGWDEAPFWGWDAPTREAAIARYSPGNDVLAEAVWHRPWGDDWEQGEASDVDLPSLDPRLVVDVLTTVDRLVKELQAAKAAVASD